MPICRSVATLVRRTALGLGFATLGAGMATAQSACETETAALQALARGVKVDITAPANLRAEGAVHIAWRAAAAFPPKTPAFVVVAVPGEVRVEAPPLPKPATSAQQDQPDTLPPDLPGALALPALGARAPGYRVRRRQDAPVGSPAPARKQARWQPRRARVRRRRTRHRGGGGGQDRVRRAQPRCARQARDRRRARHPRDRRAGPIRHRRAQAHRGLQFRALSAARVRGTLSRIRPLDRRQAGRPRGSQSQFLAHVAIRGRRRG